jgi:hypothetical protein
MFEDVRRAIQELLHGNVSPEDRRSIVAQMKETLVQARMGLDDLRQGVAITRKRLDAERGELETIRRRRTLAQGINDAETVSIAERFERQQGEKVVVLEKKLAAQEAELSLVEREVAEMTAELKAAAAGVGSGSRGSAEPPLSSGAGRGDGVEDVLDPEGARLRDELERLERERRRAAADAEADERLAALKRRMGR